MSTVNLKWEPNLLDPEVEKKGAKDVLDALTEEEKAAMPDPKMPLRHFRAEKGNAELSIKKIKATLAWRKEFEVDKIKNCMNEDGDQEMRKVILFEGSTGKLYTRGTDKEGRAAVYMRPANENSKDARDNVRFLVYNLERAIAVTEKCGLEKINLMIDYEGFRIRDSPPMSTNKWVISVLQDHYPERLYRGYVVNPGFFFRVVINLLRPFLDPVTKDKIQLCSNHKMAMEKVGDKFDLAEVEKCGGGTGALKEFDATRYFDELLFDQTFS